MREYRERNRDSGRLGDGEHREDAPRHLSCGRPSVSAWVAAAAVAFSVFLLGGFIKTYRQLQELKDESRLEIDDLRGALRRMQSQLAAAGAAPAQTRGRERERLPSIDATARAAAQTAAAQSPMRSPAQPPNPLEPLVQLRAERAANATESTIAALPAYDDPEQRGIRYQWGRTSGAPASRSLMTPAGSPSQVVSVSGANRRVMIEGGRDVDLAEGARLELCRDGRWIADLRVQDVFSNQSLCEVLHATNTPQPGDTIRMPEKSM